MRQLLFLLLILLLISPTAADADFPGVTVSNVRRVFHNGEHNAFTDLVRFRDRYYLTFRSCPDGHMVHPTASIIVLVSDDLQSWTHAHRFFVSYESASQRRFIAGPEWIH